MPKLRWYQASEVFSDQPAAHFHAEGELMLSCGVSRETVEAIEWLSWEATGRDEAIITANVPEALVAFLEENAGLLDEEGGE